MRAFLLLLLLVAASAHADQAAPRAERQDFVIGLSPFFDKSVKDEVYRGLVRLLVQDLPLNSTVAIYDSFHLTTIARLSIPDAQVFESPKTRANQFAQAIGQLKQFLARDFPRPSDPRLKFDQVMRVPQFCDFLAQALPGTNLSARLLLIGSPLYQDPQEPAFSMVDGYFPSDGHLTASREKSIFGLPGPPDPVPRLVVDWVYLDHPWVNDLYREQVTRFWSLFFQVRSGQLAVFCNDIPTALGDFCHLPSPPAAHRWVLDPAETKIEMLRISREVQTADWIQRDSVAAEQHSPSTMLGPMKIGIRWKDNIDLDLYATPRPGADTLFFQHPRSSEGFYNKDHRSSPGREYEFIEFETPVDLRSVEAFVNFYQGFCAGGPRGEVRIEFESRIYSAPFSISAENGNRGRTGSGQQQCWARIPLQDILHLPHRNRPD